MVEVVAGEALQTSARVFSVGSHGDENFGACWSDNLWFRVSAPLCQQRSSAAIAIVHLLKHNFFKLQKSHLAVAYLSSQLTSAHQIK